MGRIAPYHISGKQFNTKMLNCEQIEEVKEKYPYVVNKNLCEEYGVSKHIIVELAFHYSLRKDNSFRGWKTNDEPVDLVMFDWFYPKTSNPQLQEIFGKSDHFIRKLAKERCILKYEDVLSAKYSKCKPRVQYSSSGVHYESDLLKLEDVLYIKENYPTETNKSLSNKFNCKEGLIVSIAKYYELTKDEESVKNRKREIIINRNKNITGRNLTPELLQEIALKYHSKKEFCAKDSSAYSTSNRLGIMEDITKHMINFSFSIPQIITRQITEYLFKDKCEYNTRRIIAPYELDVHFPKLKIAFEYDGKGWHENDELDKVTLCINLNILLITISERSRRYEEDIKNQLLENLDKINSWCSTEITREGILSFNEPIDFPKLFTDEELELCRNNTVAYLSKNNKNLYTRYRKYNPDNINFKKSHKGKTVWDEEQVVAIINTYTSKGELLKNNYACYQVIHKKYRHLLPLYNTPLKKRVLCIETGIEYESISDASRKLNIGSNLIRKVCSGERSKTHEKTFKFI